VTKRERRKLIRGIIKKMWPIIWKFGLKSGEIYLSKELEKMGDK